MGHTSVPEPATGWAEAVRNRRLTLSGPPPAIQASVAEDVVQDVYAGPGGSDLFVTVLSDRLADGNWRVLTVEDVSAATGAVRHVDYGLSVPRGQSRLPQQVWLGADPSGQHLLISYAVDGRFIIGWIGQGALHRLPILQPYLPGNATLIIAW
jgi:hypothetical protein